MNADFLTPLEHVCWVLGTLCAIVAAWFKLRSTWLSRREDREALQVKYRRRWEKLRTGQYLELPECGVRWLLGIRGKPKQRVETFTKWLHALSEDWHWPIMLLISVPGTVAIWILYGFALGIAATSAALILCYCFNKMNGLPDFGETVFYCTVAIYQLVSCILVLQLSLSLTIYWTALLLLGVMPFYALMIFVAILYSSDLIDRVISTPMNASDEDALNIGCALTISFFVTAAALFVGYLCSTSVASKAALGDAAEAFEAELRRALLAHDPRGAYREEVLFHCITARPPSP